MDFPTCLNLKPLLHALVVKFTKTLFQPVTPYKQFPQIFSSTGYKTTLNKVECLRKVQLLPKATYVVNEVS